MATPLRATGTVLSHEHRSGTSNTSGNAYDFHNYRVLVGDYGTADLRVRGNDVKNNFGGQVFAKGDQVDLVVEVDTWNGNLSLNAVAVFDADSVVELV